MKKVAKTRPKKRATPKLKRMKGGAVSDAATAMEDLDPEDEAGVRSIGSRWMKS